MLLPGPVRLYQSSERSLSGHRLSSPIDSRVSRRWNQYKPERTVGSKSWNEAAGCGIGTPPAGLGKSFWCRHHPLPAETAHLKPGCTHCISALRAPCSGVIYNQSSREGQEPRRVVLSRLQACQGPGGGSFTGAASATSCVPTLRSPPAQELSFPPGRFPLREKCCIRRGSDHPFGISRGPCARLCCPPGRPRCLKPLWELRNWLAEQTSVSCPLESPAQPA